jgi:hypothetical protein
MKFLVVDGLPGGRLLNWLLLSSLTVLTLRWL